METRGETIRWEMRVGDDSRWEKTRLGVYKRGDVRLLVKR